MVMSHVYPITSMAIPGQKTWETKEVLEQDVNICNLEDINSQNREVRRSGVRHANCSWETTCSLNIKPGLKG